MKRPRPTVDPEIRCQMCARTRVAASWLVVQHRRIDGPVEVTVRRACTGCVDELAHCISRHPSTSAVDVMFWPNEVPDVFPARTEAA